MIVFGNHCSTAVMVKSKGGKVKKSYAFIMRQRNGLSNSADWTGLS